MKPFPRCWLLGALLPIACAGTHRPARPAAPDTGPASEAPAAGLAAALDQALDGSRPRDDVRVEAECRRADGYQSAVVFGSGVGIWGGKRQFRLSNADLDRVLRSFGRHRFFALDALYGGKRRPPFAITVTCSVALSIAGGRKQVSQVAQGIQSPELRRLSDEILDIASGPGAAGVMAASLADGLHRVARGELAAEVLALTANHQPPRSSDEGFLLRLGGRRLTSQPFRASEGYGDTMALLLTPRETGALAALLTEAAIWELPGNLPFAGYTDLEVSVLGQGKQIQAREFAGREVSVVEAARFEQVRGALQRLHTRAQREGGPDVESAAPPGDPR